MTTMFERHFIGKEPSPDDPPNGNKEPEYPKIDPSTLTDQQWVEELQRVTKIVKRFCRPPVDTEDLAVGILMQSVYEYNKFPVDYVLIRSRCFDTLRRLRLERDTWRLMDKESTATRLFKAGSRAEDIRNFINEVLKQLGPRLSRQQTEIIYLHYYKGLEIVKIAEVVRSQPRQIAFILHEAIDIIRQYLWSIGYGSTINDTDHNSD
jgi:DNA-directed RNA polymerase specialized sigma24 family protein